MWKRKEKKKKTEKKEKKGKKRGKRKEKKNKKKKKKKKELARKNGKRKKKKRIGEERKRGRGKKERKKEKKNKKTKNGTGREKGKRKKHEKGCGRKRNRKWKERKKKWIVTPTDPPNGPQQTSGDTSLQGCPGSGGLPNNSKKSYLVGGRDERHQPDTIGQPELEDYSECAAIPISSHFPRLFWGIDGLKFGVDGYWFVGFGFEQFLFTAVEPGSAFCQRTGAVIFGL